MDGDELQKAREQLVLTLREVTLGTLGKLARALSEVHRVTAQENYGEW